MGEAFVYAMEEDRLTRLCAHGREVTFAAWDPLGRRVVTGSRDGTVRVGPITGEEPHLLFGHEGSIWLPREELLARLRPLTNVRAVADAASPQGYRLTVDPFPGWHGAPPSW